MGGPGASGGVGSVEDVGEERDNVVSVGVWIAPKRCLMQRGVGAAIDLGGRVTGRGVGRCQELTTRGGGASVGVGGLVTEASTANLTVVLWCEDVGGDHSLDQYSFVSSNVTQMLGLGVNSSIFYN